ncbi:hypothetical protein CUMW_285510, partial [Citrus unshiu]
DDSVEGSHTLTADNFDSYSHEYPILAVNFYAPWCYWSKCLKPSWEKAAKEVMMTYNKPKHVYGSKLNNQSKCQIGTWKQ